VAAETSHAGDEVLVPLNREVVDITIRRFDRGDRPDRQRHEITVNRLEAAIDGRIGAIQLLLEAGGARVITPDRTKPLEVFPGRHRNGPVAMPGLARLAADFAHDAVQVALRQG